MDFETFWAAWPKKKGKAEARKAWDKVPEDVHMAALAAVNAQKAGDTQFNRYTPHASTWLNQQRWEDEVDSTPPREASNRHGPPDHRSFSYHDGHCSFTHNGRSCPLPGNICHGASTAPGPWYCLWHAKPGNCGHGPDQDEFFRVYEEHGKEHVTMTYEMNCDAVLDKIIAENGSWPREQGEGRTAYRNRMLKTCHALLGRLQDKIALPDIPTNIDNKDARD